MEEILAASITGMCQCLSVPVVRQIDYLVRHKRSIENLRNKVAELERARDDVQRSVEAARRSGELIKEVVEAWLTKVENIRNEATGLNREAEEINSCFKGWCCARYNLGKEAERKIGFIKELLNEGEFNSVSDPAPPPSIESMSTRDFEAFESTKSATKQVMEALNDEKINIVGVHGMGGVGKTILMKEVAKQVKKDKLFNEVVMATVSQNPDLKKIQGEIAENLGLRLQDDTELVRARRLLKRLKQEKSILVILDDLWTELELAEVGIPYRDDHKGCKVVITTRNRNICSVMKTQAKIAVEVLSEQDSWHLFRKNAGDAVDSPALHEVAWEVAKECGGLPIALVTVGRALQDKDQGVWVDVARQLKKSIFTIIEGMHSKVFSSIKLSYDCLESEETKKCFLFCCLFPEHHKISIDELMRYVMGEELLEDVDTLEEAGGRLHTVVDKLTASSLLLKGEWDGSMVMRNIVRDVAISIATKEGNGFIVKAGMGLSKWQGKDKLGECMRLSLMRNNISKLPDQPECPHLLTLSLQGNESLQKIPNSFFNGMKSLVTLDLSEIGISSLPPSLSCLDNLRTLCLDYCHHELTNIFLIGELKKLEILSLKESSIQRLPEQIGGLTNLKLLNLTNTIQLETIPPNLISSLSRLEELYMGGSFSGWEIEEIGDGSKASLAEVASLTCLKALSLHVKNVKCLSKDISNHWENLTRFCISVSDYYRDLEVPKSMCLNTSDPISNWAKVLLERTDALVLQNCRGLKNAVHLEEEGFNNLKSLYVQECLEMEYLISVMEEVPLSAFSNLEELRFWMLQNLQAICHGPLPIGFLDKLKCLKVGWCKLVNVLPSDLLVRLQNLEVLEVASCPELKEVFHSEGIDEGHATMSKLREMYLEHLPNMTTIWKGVIPLVSLQNLKIMWVTRCHRLRYLFSPNMVQRLQQLEQLHISICEEMVRIIKPEDEEVQVVEVLQNSTSSTTTASLRQSNSINFSSFSQLPIFTNLKQLEIISCGRLKHLFSMRLVRGLLQLEFLRVYDCSEMEEIIVDEEEGGEEEEDKTVLPQLRTLELVHLPQLSIFYHRALLLDWPSLEVLRVRQCTSLNRLPLGPHSAPRLKEIHGDGVEWFEGFQWEEESVKSRLQLLFQVF